MPMQGHRRGRGMAPPIRDIDIDKEWEVSATPRPLYPGDLNPVHIVQEAGLASGPVLMGAENLPVTGARSPDRPARSKSLY